jgi:TonB-linked SusC/RagA family outer membrane protein
VLNENNFFNNFIEMNNLKKSTLFLFFLFLFSLGVNAQTVKGIVTDAKGETIIGASVLEKGTTNGTITNFNGEFTLTLKSANATILVTYVGYLNEEVKPAGKTNLKLVLQGNTKLLDEVVVVGYGVQKRTSITGSVASISGEKLEKLPTDNLSNMLGGRIAGVVTRQQSGVPGENGATINIRGGSVGLILVDGVERDFSNLDPTEIESFTVLKDAASTAIYGVRGSNGVILVTTKRGKIADKISFSYDGLFTASTNTNFPTFLNGPEYAFYHNKAKDLDGQPREFDEQRIGYITNGNDPQGIWGNTDWFKLIFKPYAPGVNHKLTVTGGNDKVKFFVAGSYLKQDGIIDKVSFDRYNLRSNLDVKIAKNISLKVDISGGLQHKNQPGVTPGASDPSASTANGGATMGYKNIVYYTIAAAPVVRPQMPDGTYIGYQNPLIARDKSGFRDNKFKSIQTNFGLIYDANEFIKGLKLTANFSYDFNNAFSKSFILPCEQITPQYGTGLGIGSVQQITPGFSPHLLSGINELTDAASYTSRYTFQTIANYNNKFDNHEIGADIAWEQSGVNSNYFSGSVENLPLIELPELKFSVRYPSIPTSGSSGQTGKAGMVIRLNYAYLNKYLMQLTSRTDWSSSFLGNNKFGFFPGISLGWRMSEESFIKNQLTFIDNLKFRISWGKLGNDVIQAASYLENYTLTNSASVIFGDNGYQSIYPLNVPNKDLKWEVITSYNAGLESVFWNGLLSFEFDAFYKINDGKLGAAPAIYPSSIGNNYPSIVNYGTIDTKGFEFILGHKKIVNKSFNYSINGTFTYASARYVKWNQSPNTPKNLLVIGNSPGSVYGFLSDGLYQDENDIRYSPKISEEVRLGDIKYKDFNGDGKIDNSDRVLIANNTIPKINYGLSIDAQYKNFDLSIFLQGAAISDVMLSGTYSALGFSDGTFFTQIFKWGSNPPKYLAEGSWTPENRNAEYPRLSTQTNSNNASISDFWKRDASYIRLKNAQIGYSLPRGVIKRLKFEALKVYVSGTNLLTFSKLKFIDPEAPSVNNGYYPQQRVLSLGLNVKL